MLDSLFKNVGNKIKSCAKWIFVISAISSILTGLILSIAEDGLYFLIAILGSLIAWIGAMILYAFGELVEKTCNNENSIQQILKNLNNVDINNKDNQTTNFFNNSDTIHTESSHKWRCPNCGNMISQLQGNRKVFHNVASLS